MNDEQPIYVLNRKVALYQPPGGFRTSLDSVFVAAACPAKGGDRVLDLGCGVGGASFCLLHRVPGCMLTGVEIQGTHAALARENALLNNALDRADFVESDIADFRSDAPFDHILCNPPFLEAGAHTPSPSPEKSLALGGGEEARGLSAWIDAASRNVKPGGTLTLIHRADAIDRILHDMRGQFGAMDIMFLHPRVGADANRVIIRCIKGRKTPPRIFPPFIVHKDDGAYTDAAERILRDGAAL